MMPMVADSYRSSLQPASAQIQSKLRLAQALPTSSRPILPDPPPGRFAIWVATIGVFLPFTFGETGKYVVAVLFLPAIGVLISRKRAFALSDLFVWVMSLWMISTKISSDLLFSSISEAFAFVGSYTLARAFIYGNSAITEFVKALKIVVLVSVALSVLDPLTGSFFTSDFLRDVFHTPKPFRVEPAELRRTLLGVKILRAESIFEHPIFFGSFCSFSAAIVLFVDSRTASRLFFCAICVFGVTLSITSAAILGFALLISTYIYDRLFRSFPWRWKIVPFAAGAVILLMFAFTDNPLTWLIRHTTVDPADGYYRLLIWEDAFSFISLSPLVGADPSAWAGQEILGNSIDCVWLVQALVYGLPMVLILLLANISACGLFGRNVNLSRVDPHILRARTGLSLTLFLFVFIGLTVHYWGAIWMFWGFAIGIRCSLEEYCRKRWPRL